MVDGAYRGTPSNAGNADVILKEFYLGPIRSQINSDTLLMRRMQKRSDIVEGREVVMTLHTGRNVGTLAVSENGTLPAAGAQAYVDSRFLTRYNYGQIQLTGPLMASARTRRGAFVRAIDAEVKGLIRDFKHDLNRQLFGDASGRLAVITAVSGNDLTITGVWDSGNQQRRFRRVLPGDRLAIEDRSAAGGFGPIATSNLYNEVQSIDIGAKTVTMDTIAVTTPAAGDCLVKGPNLTDAAAIANSNYRGHNGSSVANEAKEMMGLVGICSGKDGWPENGVATTSVAEGQVHAGVNATTEITANLQGTVSAGSDWNANMDFNAGIPRPLTTDMMQQMQDDIEVAGQSTPSIIITSYDVRRRAVDALKDDRRYTGAQVYKLDGGFEAIDFNGIPMVPEKDCPEGSMFFLSEEHLMIARMSDFYWLDKDGAIWDRVDGKDAWKATLAYYAELVTDRRNAHGVIGDIQV